MYRPSTGVLDQGFDGDSGIANGDVTFTVAGLRPTVADGAQLADGSVLLTGTVPTAPHTELYVAKFRKDGTLDPLFDGPGGNGNGIARYDVFDDHDQGMSITVDSSNRILVGGASNLTSSPNQDIIALRLDPTGAYDPTFGGGDGIVRYTTIGTIGAGSNTDGARAILAAPDGGIVLVGSGCNGSPCSYALRLLADGSLDPGFDGPQGNGNGWAVITTSGTFPSMNDAVMLADGSFVTLGRRTNAPGNVLEISKFDGGTGARDLAFDGDTGSGNGQVLIDVAGAPQEAMRRIDVDQSGRLVLAGSTTYAATGEALVLRLLPDGRLDTTFDGDSGVGNGIVQTDLLAGASSDRLYGLGIQEDGAILVSGYANGIGRIVRYLSDGRLDPSFDGPGGTGNGIASLTLSDPWNELSFVAQGEDGTIRFAGHGGAAVARLGRLASSTIPNYGAGTWSSGAMFGACLVSAPGATPIASWSAGSCPSNDGTPNTWNAIPTIPTTVATTAVGGSSSATIRFGVAAPANQPPGTYRAPIAVTVVAPTA